MDKQQYGMFERWLLLQPKPMALRRDDYEWIGWYAEGDSSDVRVWRGCDRVETDRRVLVLQGYVKWRNEEDGVGSGRMDEENLCPAVDVVWYVGE